MSSMTSMMQKLGVAPVKVILGETGPYFKFADGLSSNGSPIELYFKLKFVNARHAGDGKPRRIAWLDLNILWIGAEEFPDFTNGFGVMRGGMYRDPTSSAPPFPGVLINKLMLPMGEFNANVRSMHQWLVDNSHIMEDYLNTKLLPQVNGTVYLPVSTILQHMLEQVSNEEFICEPKMFTMPEFFEYQKSIDAQLSEKYE